MIGHVLAAHNQIGGVLATGRMPSTGFVGAYDAIPNIVAAYGMRRLLTTYTGSILQLRRSSDDTEQDIGYTAEGDLDMAAVATFIGAGSGYIVNWYDQSGNAYTAAQTTADYQPLYVTSGQNGRPVVRFDGVNDFLQGSADINVPAAFTTIMALNLTSTVVGERIPLGWGIPTQFSKNRFMYISGGKFAFATWANDYVSTVTVPTAVMILWTMYLTEAKDSVTIRSNGAQVYTVVTSGLLFPNAGFYIGGLGAEVRWFKDDIAELIICNAALSDANRIAAEAAANAYWAIF